MEAERLAHALGAVRSGRQWKCKCVAHEDSAPSMIIFDGRERVQVRCLAGCETRDLIAVLRARNLWDAYALRTNMPPEEQAEKLRKNVSHETRMRERAQCVFDEAVPIVGTLAQTYLESRSILDVALRCSDIRYHARCPRERDRQPALVIAMRSFTSRAVVAVQRIFVDRDARKICAMMLGPAGGAAMMLQAPGRELHITEGLESALAVWCMDHAPVWALGSTSGIRALPPLDGVEHLTIWADHDRVDPRTGKRPGTEAARVCRDHWIAADRAVDCKLPEVEGHDAWDVWEARVGRE